MALEQKLNLRLSQKLVMTPSLQQAIKLLQMTRLELEGVLNQELIENPTLEDASLEEEAPEPEPESQDSDAEEADQSEEAKEAAELANEEKAEAAEEQAEERDPMDDIDLDAYFNDYLDYKENPTRNTFEEREAVPLENTLSEEPDLYEYLSWQVQMAELPALRREISEQIIGNLNEDGFLVATVEELQLLGASADELEEFSRELAAWERSEELRAKALEARELRASDAFGSRGGQDLPKYEQPTQHSAGLGMSSVGRSSLAASAALEQRSLDEPETYHAPEEPATAPEVPGYPASEVEAAIEYVQSLDPPGVGARDLQESLCLQLRQIGEEDSVAYAIVSEHWTQFLKRQLPAIAKKLSMPIKDLEEPVNIIKSLETRPGRRYSNTRTMYVEPDVEVVKVGDDYVVQLNDDGMPRLRVSAAYRKMLRQMKQEGREGEAQTYIKDKMRSAVWLIKSLDQRQRTIYKVANSIVKQQKGFFEKGIDYMRPMVLRDVAEDIEMHESTVSRVVSNKYIHTPRGLFPMKYFFHSGLDRSHGDDISSLTVKKKIKALIGEEDPKRPLSDSELTRRLERDGVKIARRTVAKYRDELGIPSSTDRKQIF